MTQSLPQFVYQQPGSGRFVSPFKLAYRPMKHLLLYDLSDDPHYRGFEPQLLDDPEQGSGLLVIAYRKDGMVDVYFSPDLRLNKEEYQVESGLKGWHETRFERSHFVIDPYGIEVDIAFSDCEGREIRIRIQNMLSRARKYMRLLAPNGSTIQNPNKLMLVYLLEFDFLRRPVREMQVSVGGAPRKAAAFPFPIPGGPAAFVRYAGRTMIVEMNEAHDGVLDLRTPAEDGDIQLDGATCHLVERDGHFEIDHIQVSSPPHHMQLWFSPPFPDVLALAAGDQGGGRFGLLLDDQERVCGGQYQFTCQDEQVVDIVMQIDQGWQPVRPAGLLRFVMFFSRVFKQWPTTYRWHAKIAQDGTTVRLTSAWERVAA